MITMHATIKTMNVVWFVYHLSDFKMCIERNTIKKHQQKINWKMDPIRFRCGYLNFMFVDIVPIVFTFECKLRSEI